MNEHDTERMAGLLEEQGYCPAGSIHDADTVILNTCSIRQKAEQKFYSELGRLRSLKETNPDVTIAVAGCIAQQEGRRILSSAPHVDVIFGPSDIARLPALLDRSRERRSAVIETDGDPDYHRKSMRTARAGRIKAWVSIMYGCDNYCTYCIVPLLRGRERSRPSSDIIREVQDLAGRGYKEVTLLGQNVNSYGRGVGENIDFPALLKLVNDGTEIERVRFVTSHPKDLSDGLIAAFRYLPKVCEAIHLPVQSGSDRILAAMNRHYTAADYLDKVRRLRDAVPEIGLTTDIITGFPGEDDGDFEQTMEVLRQAAFDGIFAFKYSRRPGTAAVALSGHLPEQVKEQRLTEVLELQREITIRKNRAYVGSSQKILVDGHSKKGGKLAGRTRSNKVVNFAGEDRLIGSTVTVSIKSAGVNSLTGELCA